MNIYFKNAPSYKRQYHSEGRKDTYETVKKEIKASDKTGKEEIE